MKLNHNHMIRTILEFNTPNITPEEQVYEVKLFDDELDKAMLCTMNKSELDKFLDNEDFELVDVENLNKVLVPTIRFIE